MTVRKVRTPEGAKFYGLPIGSPIAAAVVHAKNLEAGLHGVLAPQGGLETVRTPTGLKIHETSLTGKSTFTLGTGDSEVTYAVPTGSTVIRSVANPEMVYVRTPDGDIHVFNEEGEIDLGAGLTKVLTAKFGPDFIASDQYTVEHMAAKAPEPVTAPSGTLADAAPGSTAVDVKGHTIFVKNSDGSWKHDSFGVTVSAADLQHALNTSELKIVPPGEQVTVEKPTIGSAASTTIFSIADADLSVDVFIKAMPGSTGSAKVGGVQVEFTKQSDGSWTASEMGGTFASLYVSQHMRHDRDQAVSSAPPAPIKTPFDPTPSGLKNRPVGTTVTPPGETFFWEKTSDTAWSKKDKASGATLATGSYLGEIDKALYVSGTTINEPGSTKDAAPEVKAPADVFEPDLSKIPLSLAAQMNDLSAVAQQKIVADQDPPNVMMNYLVSDDDVWHTDPYGNTSLIDSDGSTFPTVGGLDAVKKIHPDFVEIKRHPMAGKNRPYGFPQKVEWVHGEAFASFGYQHSLTFYKQNRKTGLWNKIDSGGVNEFQGWTSKDGLTLSELQAQAKTKGSNPTFWFPETGEKKNWTLYTADLGIKAPEVKAPEVKAPAEKKIPETKAPATDVSAYGTGDTIAKYGHLREMAPGTTVNVHAGSYEAGKGWSAEKTADGIWKDQQGYVQPPGDLANEIIDGTLFFVSHPKGSPDEQVTLVPEYATFKKSDVISAIAALEAHTGFQISYGFKAIPDNPLADKATQDAVKAEAMQEFPDLKPKPAFVAYLKSKNGIVAPQAPAAPDTTAGSTIHFGAKVPEAKSIQGMNGGDFTVADVTEAIAILEAFKGKAFKSELNKKGNALGILNPNDLVGFDKDKTVVKEKFILLLQQKLLAGYDVPAPQAIEPEKVPETKAPEPVVPNTSVDVYGAPIGTILFGSTGITYTKTTNGGSWSRTNSNGLPTGTVNNDYVQAALDNGDISPSDPEAVSSDTEDVPLVISQLDALFPGAVIVNQDGEHLTKVDTSWWKVESSGEQEHTAYIAENYGDVTLVSEGTPPAVPAAALVESSPQVADMGVGDTMQSPGGVVYTKQDGEGDWIEPEGGVYSSDYAQVLLDDEWFTNPQPASESVAVWNGKKAKEAAVGQTAVDTSGTVITKTGEDEWSSGFSKFDNLWVQGEINAHTITAPPAASESTPDPDAKTSDDLNAAEIGSTVTSTEGVTFQKESATTWASEDHLGNPASTGWFSDTVVHAYGPFSHINPPEPEQVNPLAGMKTFDMSTGDVLIGHAGTTWTKQPDNMWSDGKGNTNTNVFMNEALADGIFESYIKAPSLAEWDGKSVADAPVEQQVVNSLNRIFTKNADGTWTKRKADGTVMADPKSPAVMQALMDVAAAGDHPYTVLPLSSENGISTWNGDSVTDAPMGQVLLYSATGMKFTKTEANTWTRTSPDGSPYQGPTVPDSFVQTQHDLGKFKVEPVLDLTLPTVPTASALPSTSTVKKKFSSSASLKSVSLEHSVVGDWIGDSYTYTKTEDGMWTDSSDGEKISQSDMQLRLSDSWYIGAEITVLSSDSGLPSVTSGLPIVTNYPKDHGMKEQDMAVGDELATASYIYTKISPTQWKDLSDGENQSSGQIQNKINDGYFVTHSGVPAIKQDPTALLPGKYSVYGAKAYMVVNSDHSGLYVAGTGTVSKMTAAKVTANYTAGMSYYQGEVSAADQPVLAPPKPKVKPDPNAPKKVPLGPVTLPDGVYYLHSASGDNATEYTISGDTVQISKDGSTAAPVPTTKIKTAFHQGKIVDFDGNSVLPVGHTGAVFLMNRPTTVAGLVEVQTILGDPDNTALDAVLTSATLAKMAQMGVSVNNQALITAIQKTTPDSYTVLGSLYTAAYGDASKWHAPAKKLLLSQIEGLLKNADTHVPEADTAALFDWAPGGQATMPLSVASAMPTNPYYNFDVPTLTVLAKKISAGFGDGKILVAPTSKYDKQHWVQYFDSGDFTAMYNQEVASLGKKGKSHPAGKMHPGHPSNSATNQIIWGPVVPGEMSAAETVPGDWSQVSVSSWSAAEIDNYLISAQMQNPTSLLLTHKRQWVTSHKNKNKKQTDKISAAAALWKVNGKPEQSAAPVWTDGVIPAKEYDFMFDSGPYPTAEQWSGQTNSVPMAWAKDNWDNPDLQAAMAAEGVTTTLEDVVSDNTGYYVSNHIAAAVAKVFGDKYDAYQAELLVPVYTLGKKIEGDTAGSNAGTHAVYITSDQFDRKYVFKPVDDPSKDVFRADVEVAANDLGRMWGFPSTPSKVVTIDGQTGILMDFVPHELALVNKGVEVKLSGLTDKQLGQIAAEHVLDWILDNDDSHRKNLLIRDDGVMVGIDKGRGLYVYGNWFGMTGTSKANSNASLVYTDMYNDIRSGKMTQAQATAAYLAAMRAAKRIQNADDVAAEDKVREGVKNRTKWSPNYTMSHYDQTQAPQDADGLVKAFLDRKHGLVNDVEKMWTSIFNASSYDKPEIPPKALGDEHFSGWGEEGLDKHITETKVWGTTALHFSPGISNGSSLLWEEKNTSGEDVHKGTMTILPLTQKKILGFLDGMAPTTSDSSYQQSQSSNIQGFPDLHPWKSTISAASKDASKHVADKVYTAEKWTNFEATADKIEKDLAFWGDVDLNGPGNQSQIIFPSGTSVPMVGMLQYKMALTHYQTQVAKVRKVKQEGLTTTQSDFTLFQPIAIKTKSRVFEGPDGEKYTELVGGSYMHIKSGQVSMDAPPSDVLAGTAAGWTEPGKEAPAVVLAVNPIKYVKISAYEYKGDLSADGTLVGAGSTYTSASQGKQYNITLPTGETISFRNSDSTNTHKSQRGRLTFTLTGDLAVSLARVQAQLDVMGLNTDGVEEEDAETVYWRAMFFRVLHSSGASGKVGDARNKLKGMYSSLGQTLNEQVNKFSVVEAVGLTRTPTEERAFWHDLAVEAWGKPTVDAWLTANKHLPTYHHMDFADAQKSTGRPVFQRIDFDLEKAYGTGTMMAIGNSGKDESLLNYFTTGGMMATEERIRALGWFKQGTTSVSDQTKGGANGVFTRLAVPGSAVEKTGNIYGQHVAYWSPTVMGEVGTYANEGDQFGNTDYMESQNPLNSTYSLLHHKSTGNETLIANTLSIYDHLEIMIFESDVKRQAAIQKLKVAGITVLRGLPVEERMIMRNNLNATLKKVREQWLKK